MCPPDIVHDSVSFGSLDHAAHSSNSPSLSSLPPGSLLDIQENEEVEPALSAAAAAPSQALPSGLPLGSGGKNAARQILNSFRRGSKEDSPAQDSNRPPTSRGRRKSSIFNNMLRRVSIHRRDSTPNGRIATFFFGAEKSDDEHGEQGLLRGPGWMKGPCTKGPEWIKGPR